MKISFLYLTYIGTYIFSWKKPLYSNLLFLNAFKFASRDKFESPVKINHTQTWRLMLIQEIQ